MAEQTKRAVRRAVPREIQDVLEQYYSTNPYPSRFDFLFLSRNARFELARLKNWFNNRRRSDARSGNLCKRCRSFKAPLPHESHLDESRRPCLEYWNLYNEIKKEFDLHNNNQEANNTVDSSSQSEAAAAIVHHHAPASLAPGNYTHFIPANPLSSYVDTAALFRFMDAWQRSSCGANESLPFYNQQFLFQQQQQHQQHPTWFNQYTPLPQQYLKNNNNWTMMNQQVPRAANRNYQPESFHFNSQQPTVCCCQSCSLVNDFTLQQQNASETSANNLTAAVVGSFAN